MLKAVDELIILIQQKTDQHGNLILDREQTKRLILWMTTIAIGLEQQDKLIRDLKKLVEDETFLKRVSKK